MSVRQSASTMDYNRSTDLPSETTMTIMGWFRLVSDRNVTGRFFTFIGASGSIGIRVTSTGTRFSTTTGAAAGTAGTDLTVGTWYHLTMTHVTGASNLKGYVNGVLDSSMAGITLGTPSGLFVGIGGAGAASWVDADVQAIKAWNAVLSPAEIVNEMWSVIPVRFADLYGWWPMLNIDSDELDMSGFGRNWTVTGSPTTGDHAPVSWRQKRRRLIVPAAAAGPSGQPMMARYMGNPGLAVGAGVTRRMW